MKNTLFLLSLILSSTMLYAQGIDGTWRGLLVIEESKMDLLFTIKTDADKLTSTIDVPSQGISGIDLGKTTFADNILTITSVIMQITYTGTLDGDNINGTYKQGDKEVPLNLTRTIKKLPGDITLPTTDYELDKIAALETGTFAYSVEDFFKTPAASSFRLSPKGTLLAYLKRTEEGKKNLYIKNTETQEEKCIIVEEEDIIRGFFWANDTRILYLQDKGGNENHHVYGVDIDGSNKKELTPFDGVKVSISASLKDDKDHIIINMNKNNPQLEEPYKLNINTGEIEQLYEIKEGDDPIAAYDFDKDGNLRLLYKLVNGVEMDILYKLDGEWTKIKTIGSSDNFNIISFNYASKNPNEAYVLSNLESDKSVIQLYDLKKNEIIKTLYSNDEFDMSSIALSRKRKYEIDLVYYNGEKMTLIPVSKTYKKIHARIQEEFGEKEFFMTGRSEDENIYLFVVTSDKVVGEYYTYNVKEDKVTELYKVLPHLKEKDMSPMTPISFMSRDGLKIHGYLTMPAGAKANDIVPMVVIPHGGPQGVRDSWGFNPEVQLFASRGYAVLTVNFRISGGYGKAFMKAGYKQIGRKVMDDVEDGIAYVLQKGEIDKDKIAIYGGSHGGYAVLRGLTKTPNLYACGVDYVGVSNLNTFMSTIPPYWEKYLEILYETWYNPNLAAEKIIMDEISPALHTDKIVKPLFVIQGANDPRVNIDEADQIVRKLRERGMTVPYMVKYDEGHGFAKEENRIALYKTMMGFLAEHLK